MSTTGGLGLRLPSLTSLSSSKWPASVPAFAAGWRARRDLTPARVLPDLFLGVGMELPCTVMECGAVIYRSTLHRNDGLTVTARGVQIGCSLMQKKVGSLVCQHHENGRLNFAQRCFAAPLVAAVVLALSTPCFVSPPACLGQSLSNGATLFGKACIGCHDMGGNIIQPGATLFLKDLQRNGFSTEEEIYNITYYGKGRMPGFGEKCTPRGQCTFGPRLQEDEIKQLAEFVKAQADQGWPKISYGE